MENATLLQCHKVPELGLVDSGAPFLELPPAGFLEFVAIVKSKFHNVYPNVTHGVCVNEPLTPSVLSKWPSITITLTGGVDGKFEVVIATTPTCRRLRIRNHHFPSYMQFFWIPRSM